VYVFHGPPHADVVTVNDSLGGYALGLRLAELGHRRVAFIGPDTWMAWSRLFGLRLALQRTGGACPPEVVCMRRRRGGQEALFMDALLAGETRPDAIRQRFTAARASQKKQFLFGVGGKAKAEGWSEQKRKGGEGV
jgi:DNA-binding LacI/PurR family transcriptional regulator